MQYPLILSSVNLCLLGTVPLLEPAETVSACELVSREQQTNTTRVRRREAQVLMHQCKECILPGHLGAAGGLGLQHCPPHALILVDTVLIVYFLCYLVLKMQKNIHLKICHGNF